MSTINENPAAATSEHKRDATTAGLDSTEMMSSRDAPCPPGRPSIVSPESITQEELEKFKQVVARIQAETAVLLPPSPDPTLVAEITSLKSKVDELEKELERRSKHSNLSADTLVWATSTLAMHQADEKDRKKAWRMILSHAGVLKAVLAERECPGGFGDIASVFRDWAAAVANGSDGALRFARILGDTPWHVGPSPRTRDVPKQRDTIVAWLKKWSDGKDDSALATTIDLSTMIPSLLLLRAMDTAHTASPIKHDSSSSTIVPIILRSPLSIQINTDGTMKLDAESQTHAFLEARARAPGPLSSPFILGLLKICSEGQDEWSAFCLSTLERTLTLHEWSRSWTLDEMERHILCPLLESLEPILLEDENKTLDKDDWSITHAKGVLRASMGPEVTVVSSGVLALTIIETYQRLRSTVLTRRDLPNGGTIDDGVYQGLLREQLRALADNHQRCLALWDNCSKGKWPGE